MDDAAALAAALSAAVGNLDAYIDRKAAEKAAPAVAEAERAANEAIRQAQADVQRERDLLAELRRRLHALEQQRGNTEVAWNRIATALGYRHYRSQPVEALAAQVKRKVAEDAATIERLRGELRDAVEGALVRDVPQPAMSGEGDGTDGK